jgi:glycine betaine/proline transport system substrate-binding protein
VIALLVATVLTACGSLAEGDESGGGPAAGGGETGGTVTMARATWDTGYMQAAIYAQVLDEMGYDVTDPAERTMNANVFYPALAQGQVDLWVNGWFPLHDIYLDRTLFSGQTVSEPIEPVGTEVQAGALQGYLIDKASADALGITSMDSFADPAVAAVFDQDGDGLADLQGCNEGWGCNLAIGEHIEQLAWGANVEQVVGDYNELMSHVQTRIESGEPVLFYTWTPNWTIDVLEPGVDVVWLESSPLDDVDEDTTVSGLEGCAAGSSCELGWVVNDIRAVANSDFLDANPPVRRLLELVEIPLSDIDDQNARMAMQSEYGEDQIRADAAQWIEDNRSMVDGWIEEALTG